MRFTFWTLLTFFTICLIACQSDDPEKQVDGIEFTVLDDSTHLPIEGVRVQILEGGDTFTTNASGSVNFTTSDLAQATNYGAGDSSLYAFSFSQSGYRPIELNASAGRIEIGLTPLMSSRYSYHRPVLVDDGLPVGQMEEVGIDTTILLQGMRKIAAANYRDLHSVLIYKDGKLVVEEYYFGNNDTIQFENGIIRDKSPAPIQWTRNEPHYVASVNKALTGTLMGIAMEEFNIASESKLKDYLPRYASHFEGNTNKSMLSFHHALNMTMGFQWDEWGSNDLALLWKSPDFTEFLLSRSNKGPGREWIYNSASPNMLLHIIDGLTEEPVRTWAQRRFYGPLGITNFKWQSQPGGLLPEGAARMYLRPRDMLKVGITYLQKGIWDGQQVVPQSWVEKCFTVQATPDAGDYSHFFWHRTVGGVSYLSADGDGGNFINIFPEQNMVIVFTQGNYLQWPLYVNQANDIMGNFVLKALE